MLIKEENIALKKIKISEDFFLKNEPLRIPKQKKESIIAVVLL